MTRRFLVNITERPIFRFESLEVFLYSHFDNILGVFTRMRPEKKNDSEHLQTRKITFQGQMIASLSGCDI